MTNLALHLCRNPVTQATSLLGEPPIVVYPGPLPVRTSSVVNPPASLTVCTFGAAADAGGGGPSDYAIGHGSAYVKVGDPALAQG